MLPTYLSTWFGDCYIATHFYLNQHCEMYVLCSQSEQKGRTGENAPFMALSADFSQVGRLLVENVNH